MDRYLIPPGTELSLAEWDPADLDAFGGGKDAGKARLKELKALLEELQ